MTADDAWVRLLPDYEARRAREDSLDATLRDARSLLRDDGVLVVSRAHPIRFAVERSEAEGIPLGDAYHAGTPITYASSWNESVSVTQSAETFAAMINNLSAADFRVERVVEPQLSDEQQRRYPHKQAWMAQYVGIIVFRARPVPCS